MRKWFASMFLWTALLSWAQPSDRPDNGRKPVKGAAYAAVRITVQFSAGNQDTRSETVTQVYRDSAGRTRTDASPPILAEIQDPVRGVIYTLDPRQKIAFRRPLPKESHPASDTQSGACPSAWHLEQTPGWNRSLHYVYDPPLMPCHAPKAATENLGTRMIEGVLAKGKWTATGEIWASPRFHVAVLSIQTDSRGRVTIERIRNIRRTEPDPALFRPPADYAIVKLLR